MYSKYVIVTFGISSAKGVFFLLKSCAEGTNIIKSCAFNYKIY
jgi:hypothetical protein